MQDLVLIRKMNNPLRDSLEIAMIMHNKKAIKLSQNILTVQFPAKKRKKDWLSVG